MDTNNSTPAGLVSATLRTTALILGASLGFVGALCGAMLVASVALGGDAGKGSRARPLDPGAAPAAAAPGRSDETPRAPIPARADPKKPGSSI